MKEKWNATDATARSKLLEVSQNRNHSISRPNGRKTNYDETLDAMWSVRPFVKCPKYMENVVENVIDQSMAKKVELVSDGK